MGEKDIEVKHKKSFAEQVDEVKNGTYNRYNALKVCDTPQILLDAGCEQLPMLYTQRHLIDAMRDDPNDRRTHGLDESLIKSIPDLISAPAMIFDSMTRDDAIIVCTDKTDKKNNPVIISVKPNDKGIYELAEISTNFITSIYGKKNYSDFIERIINENKMLYWNKEKSQELFSLLQLQLPRGFNNLGSNIILQQSSTIVKQNKHKLCKISNEAIFIGGII